METLTTPKVKVDVDVVIKKAGMKDRSSYKKVAEASVVRHLSGQFDVDLLGPACGERYKTPRFQTMADAIYAAVDWADARKIRIIAWN